MSIYSGRYSHHRYEHRRQWVGLFGGSFNPPHKGHKSMALCALHRLGLHEVWFVVSPQNPHKPKEGMADFRTRFDLCTLLTGPHPRLKVSDYEQRHGLSYTAETISHLVRAYPRLQFVWLMGEDNMTHFHLWQHWDSIAAQVPIVIFNRTDETGRHLSGLHAPAFEKMRHSRVSAKEALASEAFCPQWRLLDVPLHPARATNIRTSLQTALQEPNNTAPCAASTASKLYLTKKQQESNALKAFRAGMTKQEMSKNMPIFRTGTHKQVRPE